MSTSEAVSLGDRVGAADLLHTHRVIEGMEREASDPCPSLSGVQKAAILLLSLEEDAATEVFKCLSDDHAKALSQEIVRMGVVGKERVLAVLAEFEGLRETIDVGDGAARVAGGRSAEISHGEIAGVALGTERNDEGEPRA